MRQRIVWVVAATTSAVVAAFVIPLCLLVASLAETRGADRAREQAQSVAALVGSVTSPADLQRAVTTLSSEGPDVIVVAPDGSSIGASGPLARATTTAVRQARESVSARTIRQDHGVDALVPVVVGGQVSVVVATVPEADLRSGVSAAWVTICALGVGLVILAVLIARALGARVSTPVTRLGAVAHRLTEGDLTARADLTGPAETVEVARALNGLADRIDALVTAEREQAADLAHRLRTPVTALRLATDLVEDRAVTEQLRPHVDALQRGVDALVRDARRASRERLPSPSDLTAVVRERASFWAALAEDQGRSVRLDLPHVGAPPLRVPLAEHDIVECLDILFDNLFSHTPEGAPVLVRVRSDDVGTMGTPVQVAEASFEVSDGGPGLPAGYRGRGHSGGGSTGLGLDIIARMAERVGGRLELATGELGGLSARVWLPRVG